MRIGIVYYGIEPRNRGLDQLAQALLALGHKPFIVTRRSNKLPPVQHFNGVPVIQLPMKSGAFSECLSFPVPLNILWLKWIISLATELSWQAIFLRESPLAISGLMAGKHLRIPVFLDMRENLPATYAIPNRNKPLWKLIRQDILAKIYERLMLPRFNHIFTSTTELGEWIIKDYGISPHIHSVLRNYPSQLFLEQAEQAIMKNSGQKKSDNDPIYLAFAGWVTENRGIQDIIRALRLLKNCVSLDVSLNVIGDGPYLKNLKKLVYETETSGSVKFIPMLLPSEVANALAVCDIGICSYLLSEQTHQTLPGKLFEYMAVGLPVLSSARRPVVKIIEEVECGIIYRSRRAHEISGCILKLANDKDMRENMGNRGREAVLKHYNWKNNLKSLSDVLQKYS